MKITIDNKEFEYNNKGQEDEIEYLDQEELSKVLKDRINIYKGKLNKVWESGIFELDEFGMPKRVFKLVPGEKTLSKKYTLNISPKVADENLSPAQRKKEQEANERSEAFQLANKLKSIINRNLANRLSLEDYVVEETQKAFENDLNRIFLEYDLNKQIFESHLSKLLCKARKQIKNGIKTTKIYKQGAKQQVYEDLVHPLFHTFKETFKETLSINEKDCFHYIAHLLIATGIEKPTERGHLTAFDKVRQYYYRQKKHPPIAR